MKIVHLVLTDNFAGVESYICDVSTELTALGHEVVVIGGEADRMRARLPPSVASVTPRNLVHGALLARRHIGPGTVLHVHMTAAEVAGRLATLFDRRTPVVATRHFAQRRGSSTLGRVGGAWAARRITTQLSISQFVADSIGEPSTVLLNGVPPRPQGPHDEKVALVAQRLESEKDGETVIRGWASSGLQDLGWRLAFAGRGSLEEDLRQLGAEFGVAPSIDWLGFVENVPELMDRSSVFLASAPAEPFGLSVAEAMACGLAVVAAGGGAHLETIGAARPDLLFPPGDADRLGAILRSVATDGDLRASAGTALRETQRLLLDIGDHCRRLVAVYAGAWDRTGKTTSG